jgi:sRNA-binding protein
MSYRLSRDQRDLIVAKLAAHYPACFFEEPRLRRPLKRGILADLYADGFPFTPDETAEAVDWYESHFAYRHAVQAGAKRVDLSGREAGTVTLAEQRSAELYIAKRKQEMQDRNLLPAVRTTLALHRAGEIPDDALRKITVSAAATDSARSQARVDNVAGAVIDAADLRLASARKVDAGNGDGAKKRHKRLSPPCPTCGANSKVIATVQVEGGAVIRTRRCWGGATHLFQTREASIPL